jgi:SAM-dependent methyltransferase
MTAPESPSERFWEAHYQGMEPAWGTRPNRVLAALVNDLNPAPGLALDLGCGHGGDALWLASNGWQVTAVDVSAAAVARVAAAAQKSGLTDRLTAIRQDLAGGLPAGPFDLVYACYFHTPVNIDRDAIISRASSLLFPKGLLVVVDHGSSSPWSWGHPDQTFPTPHETLTRFDLGNDLRVVRTETAWREASGPDGQHGEVADNIIVAQRA